MDIKLRAGEHEFEPCPISDGVPECSQEGARRVGLSVDGGCGLGGARWKGACLQRLAEPQVQAGS